MSRHAPTALPVVLYDGDCGFCKRWVARWRARTRAAVLFLPFQRPGILEEHGIRRADAERALQFIGTRGERAEGAEAVFRALAYAPEYRWAGRLMARAFRLPPFRRGSETVYRLIARHRGVASRIDWLLFGESSAPPRLRLTRALYFRALGVTYLAAFSSLRGQVRGLFGSRGILPVREYLGELGALLDRRGRGKERYRLFPTIFWRGASDRALVRACLLGQLLSVLLVLGIAPRAVTAALGLLYLSFVSVGGPFLAYQWDALLLEASFASVIAAPPGRRSRLAGNAAGYPAYEDPPWLVSQLLRFLFVRLHFESGLCKLQSGDPNWRGGTACSYHYETQPLPTPVGWYAHQLPARLQRLSTRLALGIELLVPWLVYYPRRVRRLASGVLLGFQGLIALTGNYGFFNLLTGALGLWAADDAVLARLLHPLSSEWRARLLFAPGRPAPAARWLATSAAALPLLALSVLQLLSRIPRPGRLALLRRWLPRLEDSSLVARGEAVLQPLRALNSYGLFSVMTTTRPEIVVEGSRDGVAWRPYEFRYKPGHPLARPRFVAPHQPRLDWQMWFAAMESPPEWFMSFVQRLLEGTPEVLRLLKDNPFPEGPPRYIRAALYEYRMATLRERRERGAWWRRERLGLYLPVCELQEGERAA